MNGQSGGLGSWGWGGVGFWDQCTLIGRWINQSSPWGAVESNGERLKCFVWVSPMAWPCWLSVSQGELYLLQLQALYCRTLFRSRRNPYTPLHKYYRSLLSQAITTDTDQCSLTVISLLDSRNALFPGVYLLSASQSLKQTSKQKDLWQQQHCREVSSFISIHLRGEPYFACHNEFEEINKHQLSGMYYNWKAERLEWVRSHTRSAVFLLRISTVPLKGIGSVNVEMNHCRKVNQCWRGDCLNGCVWIWMHM